VSSGAAVGASARSVKFFLNRSAIAVTGPGSVWRLCAAGLLWPLVKSQGGGVLLNQVLMSAVRSNSAVERDAFRRPLRASHSAPHRGR
jgi:hypothetical protein